ncbi:MAG: PKD domain-containing protein [Flavobacteriales bacterium]|nr:gliding motility-associated C-terminal domain-containing protein [Flavobacteriales bacterium]
MKHSQSFSVRTWTERALIGLSTILVGPLVQAQEFYINEGEIYTCQGALLDTGGNTGEYGNNEDFTLTICSDGTGPAISLQWVIFNLSTAGVAPLDEMSIYDGQTTSDPLIGTWSGSNSPGIITASFDNPTGCLTVVFTSNGTGTGDFAANISCFAPCEPPTAAATMGEAIPALVCQGEELTFDGSASTAVEGFNIVQYRWDFADGTLDSLSGAVATHAFDDAGEYVVQLTVTDDNGCTNTNLVDLQVLVSTTPLFTGTTPSTEICLGESVPLTADPTAVQWSALPETNLGGSIALPDLQGVPFNTSLTFNNFAPGQTLTDPNDLLSVCVSMEHSWMADLVISLACPNGQSVVFHQQGGGGTYIGGANDNDGTNPSLGECWDYCWSPTATNGTWVQAVAANQTTQAGTPASAALNAGTYSSVGAWSGFAGCPLNGTWTFTVNDLFAIDNGFICDWSINFDPSLFPSLTEFTPVLGTSTADSASWAGNGFVPDPNDPLSGVATPTSEGVFDYVFSVTDNFGCTYDTTITITVNPGVEGPIVLTGDQVVCDGGLAFINAPAGYDSYNWNNGSVGANISGGPGTYIVTVGLGDCTLPSEPFVVTEAESPDPVITGPNFTCGGNPISLGTTEQYASYAWSNGSQTPTTSVNTGSYTVTVTNAEGCTATSAPFSVVVGSEPTASFYTDPVSPQPPGATVNFFDTSNGNGSTITGWEWTFGLPGAGSSMQNPSYLYNTPGEYPVTLIVTTAEGCVDTLFAAYIIRPLDITVPNVFSPNGDGYNDFLVFDNVQYYKNTLSVFNRWGQEVYQTANYRNTWRATDVPDGTYFFVLRLSETGKEYTGHLTILR